MSSESNDSSIWVPDKAPPNKLSEDYLKEEAKSAKNGIGGLLMIGFSVARAIQVFSRVPGTAGVYHYATFFVGIGLQAVYLIGHQEKYGRVDATDFRWLIFAQLACWFVAILCELVRTVRRSPRIQPTYSGRGILCQYLPSLTTDVGGIISDVAVAAGLIALLHAIGSSVQANTYKVILGLTMFCHACVHGQRFSYRQRVRYARRRARHWPNDVRGRHHL